MTEFYFAGLGTLINVAGIIVGGLIGLFGGKFLTEKIIGGGLIGSINDKLLHDATILIVKAVFPGRDNFLRGIFGTVHDGSRACEKF